MSLELRLRHEAGGFSMDIAFEAPGGVTALLGRSGAGKTTVVNAVAGLLRPREALIRLEGRVLTDTAAGVFLPPEKRRVGYVFQDARLFPHLSVAGNLRYGQRLAKGRPQVMSEAQVVPLLGLEHLLERRPATLSGGEKQRAAIGRALLSQPELLLLDEPLAALDGARKDEILPFLERLRDEAKIPMLYVSHAIEEAARLAGTLVVIQDGRVLRAGPATEVLSDPEAVPMVGVREAGAVLTGRVLSHGPDGLAAVETGAGVLHLPGVTAPEGAGLRLRVPASEVLLSLTRPEGLSALNVLPVRVTGLRRGGGPGMAVALEAGGARLLARVAARSAEAMGLREGLECYAIVNATALSRGDIGGGNPDGAV